MNIIKEKLLYLLKTGKKRINKPLYSFKEALGYSLPFSFAFILWEVGFSVKFFYKFPLFFFISFSIYFLFAYFISYKLKEKNYQKYKKQGF